MAKQKTSAKTITINQRRLRAVSLRKTGAPLEAVAAVIAKEFGLEKYDKRQAFQDIDVELRNLNAECTHETEEYRRLELERLDHLYIQAQDGVKNKDVKAISVSVQIIDRRCKILGLEAPVQLMVQQATEAEVDGELRNFIQLVKQHVSESAYGEILDAVRKIGEEVENDD